MTRLLTCSYCDPPQEFHDYVRWFTHKVMTGHHKDETQRETTTMGIDTVGEATGAIASIEDSLKDRIDIIAAGATVIEDLAGWTSAQATTLNEIISATNEQTTEIEQDLITLADVRMWLEESLTVANARDWKVIAGQIERALTSVEALDGKLRSAMTAIGTLREAMEPVQQASADNALALVRLAGTSTALQQQISAVRHDADETRQVIAAISAG